MDIKFLPNGDIEGYKTTFMKKLTNDNSGDFVHMKHIGKLLIAFCIEQQGHFCTMCGHKVQKFAEIPNNSKKMILCSICIKRIHQTFEEIT